MDAQATVSPYLPGTKIMYAWDSTSLGYLKVCPRLYQYIMIEGWQAKEESIHLRFGQEYHSAIQDYDIARAASASFNDAVRSTVRKLLCRIHAWDPDRETKAGHYKNPKSLVGLVIDYLDHYRDDPAQTYIMANGKPAVELSFKFELDWGPQSEDNYYEIQGSNGDRPKWRQPYLLCGHLDRVVTLSDTLFVLDHKTTTSSPGAYYFNQYEPNNQMTLYTLAGQLVLGSPIKGVIVEAAQVMLDSPNRFVRGMTYRTQDQLNEWVNDLHHWFSLAESYANANYWPMNDTACDKFGGCRFREVCSKSPGVRSTYLRSGFVQLPLEERWNPLKPR